LVEQSGCLRDIRESSVAIVPIEDVLPPVRDEKIVETIIIKIPYGDRRCPACPMESRLLGHVGESAVAVVPVETIGGALRAFNRGAAQDKDVEPTVVVVVQEGSPAAYRFENI